MSRRLLTVPGFLVAALLEDSRLAWREGLLLLGGLVAYTGLGLHVARREKQEVQREFEEALPGSIPDVLDSTSRIAERYLETLEQGKVAT